VTYKFTDVKCEKEAEESVCWINQSSD